MVEHQLHGLRALRRIANRAILEASRLSSPNVEAEHVLLALASEASGATTRTMVDEGLSYQAIDDALRREHEQSLRAAGIEPVDESRLVSTRRRGRPGWGASAKEAFTRASHGAGRGRSRHRIQEFDLLLGVLQANLGTVPRALQIAGFDRAQLLSRLQAAR